MVSGDQLLQWLQQPESLTAKDRESLDKLVHTWPYFVPGRYARALQEHREQAFAPEMLGRMQLFSGNWYGFYRMLQPAEAAPVAWGAEPEIPAAVPEAAAAEDPVTPVYTEDYFLHQGIRLDAEPPAEQGPAAGDSPERIEEGEDAEKSLMVVMSFREWLNYFSTRNREQKQEEEEQRLLKVMWRKEKLAAAMEEENDEIPENVFKMAVDSISREDDLVSESLAEILVRQGKYEKAVDMYRKLSLRNPAKSTYFASRIEKILKEKES